MATIKTVTIEYSYTFNLGNYSSVRPSVSLTAELVEGADVNDVIATLQEDAEDHVKGTIDAELLARGVQPYFATRRAEEAF